MSTHGQLPRERIAAVLRSTRVAPGSDGLDELARRIADELELFVETSATDSAVYRYVSPWNRLPPPETVTA